MSIEYGLVFTLFFGAIRYSIFDSFCPGYSTLTYFSKFKIIVGLSLFVFANNFFWAKKKQKQKIFNNKVASHILCPSSVCKLPHEYEDITKNAWRTPINAQCNIEYRLQYFLFFTFFKLPSKSIICLLF